MGKVIRVSEAAAVRIAEMARLERRTVVAVVDRLAGVPGAEDLADRSRVAVPEVVLCECGHPEVSHPHKGRCLMCKGACPRFRPAKGD